MSEQVSFNCSTLCVSRLVAFAGLRRITGLPFLSSRLPAYAACVCVWLRACRAVESEALVYKALEQGEQNRHVGATNMNERSSRSHTIFRVFITSTPRAAGAGAGAGAAATAAASSSASSSSSRASKRHAGTLRATLNLVDLAGSERAAHTQATGQRLREGSHINKSLLTLGTVIRKLSEGETHVPFRDSKLTHILKPALGGNNRTSVVCCVTQAAAFAQGE